MKTTGRSIIHWSPRIITILFILFISMFAADVFEETHTFWETVVGLFMHLIPTWIMIITLILAWRWQWVGSLIFLALGTLYIFFASARHFHLSVYFLIAGPAFLIAGLFFADWLQTRREKQLAA